MGRSSRRGDDYDDDRYSRDRRRDRSSSRSRSKKKDKYYDDDDEDKYSSKKDKDKKKDRKKYDDDDGDRTSSKRDGRNEPTYDDGYSTTDRGGGGGGRDRDRDVGRRDGSYRDAGAGWDARSTQAPASEYGGQQQGFQQAYQQQYQPGPGYGTTSQEAWNAPPTPPQQQAQYGSAPQPRSWPNDARYASPAPQEFRPPPPRDNYPPSNSYSAPPPSSYGGQSERGGGWENYGQPQPNARDPRFDQGSLPPPPPAPQPPYQQALDYDRPPYSRAPASAPDSYRRDYAQTPPERMAPPFAGPPPPPSQAPPPPGPAQEWQDYYARQAQQTENGAKGHWKPGENGQWTWVVVAPEPPPLPPQPPAQAFAPPPPPPSLHPPAYPSPPIQGYPSAQFQAQIGSLPAPTYPLYSPPPPPSASAPPSTINPYAAPLLQMQPPQMYPAPPAPVPSALAPPPASQGAPLQPPQVPPVPPQTPSYGSQQPVYQLVQPVEIVQPGLVVPPPPPPPPIPPQAIVLPPPTMMTKTTLRPKPSAPSVPAESEYSDESRGRRRGRRRDTTDDDEDDDDDDDDDESDTRRSRRGRSRSRSRSRRRARSTSRSSNRCGRNQSRSRAGGGGGSREYEEYEEKHYVRRSDPTRGVGGGRRDSYVEDRADPRYDDRTRREDSTRSPAPHLVRRIDVYEGDDDRDRGGRRDGPTAARREVYEMRSLGKGTGQRRGSMVNPDAERQRQLAAQVAEEEAAILRKRFGSKARDTRRPESDESWEKVEAPPAARRARRNSVANSFRQNHAVEYSEEVQGARPSSQGAKPSIDNAKASRIAAWSMSIPNVEHLSLGGGGAGDEDDRAISRPRSAMKGGRAHAATVATAAATLPPPIDDLDSVVEPFDPFAPVTTAQSASSFYPSWQQTSTRR